MSTTTRSIRLSFQTPLRGRLLALVLGSALLGPTFAAAGQETAAPPGPPVGPAPRATDADPEKARATWEMEASGVAARLGLSDEATKTVVGAYVESRAVHAMTLREKLDEARATRGADGPPAADRPEPRGRRGERAAGGRGAAREALRAIQEELAAEHSKRMQTSLAGVLDAQQLASVQPTLGSINPEWDRMVGALSTLDLEASATRPALNAIEAFVATTATHRQPGADRRATRDEMQAARATLGEALGKVLSDEQMKAFETAVSPRRGDRGSMAERLKAMDADGNGTLERDELPERMQRMFDRLDINGDGSIDEAELAELRDRRGDGRRGAGRAPRGIDT